MPSSVHREVGLRTKLRKFRFRMRKSKVGRTRQHISQTTPAHHSDDIPVSDVSSSDKHALNSAVVSSVPISPPPSEYLLPARCSSSLGMCGLFIITSQQTIKRSPRPLPASFPDCTHCYPPQPIPIPIMLIPLLYPRLHRRSNANQLRCGLLAGTCMMASRQATWNNYLVKSRRINLLPFMGRDKSLI